MSSILSDRETRNKRMPVRESVGLYSEQSAFPRRLPMKPLLVSLVVLALLCTMVMDVIEES